MPGHGPSADVPPIGPSPSAGAPGHGRGPSAGDPVTPFDFSIDLSMEWGEELFHRPVNGMGGNSRRQPNPSEPLIVGGSKARLSDPLLHAASATAGDICPALGSLYPPLVDASSFVDILRACINFADSAFDAAAAREAAHPPMHDILSRAAADEALVNAQGLQGAIAVRDAELSATRSTINRQAVDAWAIDSPLYQSMCSWDHPSQ